ncbi:MAG: hypothetical protein [Bacteriophage sp.]|nr:MAG: hypothetical protein [Bacteriophage sp.]
MAVKSQGSDLYFIAGGTLYKANCITSFTPGDDAADQLETTCLQERSSRTYASGLSNPAQASIAVNFDPSDPVHLKLWELKQAGGNDDYSFALGFSDGEDDPTVADADSATEIDGFELPATRTWYTFLGQLAGYSFDFQLNALVTGTITLTRSGAPHLTPKSGS